MEKPVRAVNAQSLTLDSSKAIDISSDGTVRQDGNLIGQLEIADFTSTAGLSKAGQQLLPVTDPSVRPSAASGTLVHQGKLEGSNTGSAEGAIRLVSVDAAV